MAIKRILVMGSERGDFFAHNVAYTLRKMNFEVFSDPRLGSSAAQAALVRRVDTLLGMGSKWWSQMHDRRSIELVNQCRPDLVIVCTRTYEPETVQAWRRTGALAICWYGDAPANIPKGHITSDEYDAVFVKDERFARDLRLVLKLPAYFLPEACNPDWHKPSGMQVGQHLTFAGTMYGYRNRVAELLMQDGYDLRCYGPAPSAWTSAIIKKSHTGQFLDHTSKAKIFESSLACINTFAPAERDALNCRIFETCGSGGLLITENKSVLADFFEPDAEILTFASYDELSMQIEKAQSDPSLSERIRRRGYLRAHSEHSYEHRLQTMLSIIET
jgi:spore maturation protein CgeB